MAHVADSWDQSTWSLWTRNLRSKHQRVRFRFAWFLRPLSHSLTLQVQGYKHIKAEGLGWGDGESRLWGTNRRGRRSRSGGMSGRMKRVAFSGWFKRKEIDIFLNPFEAKRLNRNFLLSGAMQGPHHFLCFALMCLQREEGRLNTALPHARKHSSATFSWPRFTVNLCARNTDVQKQQPPPSVSHSTLAFRGHLNLTPDSRQTPCLEQTGVITSHHLLCFYVGFRRVILKNFHSQHTHWLWMLWFVFFFIWRWTKRCLVWCPILCLKRFNWCRLHVNPGKPEIIQIFSKITITISYHVVTLTSDLRVKFFYCHPLKGHCFILESKWMLVRIFI